MGTTTFASLAEFKSVQERVKIISPEALSDVIWDNINVFRILHNDLYNSVWADALAAELSGDPEPTPITNETIGQAVSDYLAANPPSAGVNSYYIWAEENGGIASNAYEWSYGNGATGNDIGIPIMVRSQLTHMSLNADVAGTSATINAKRQSTAGTDTGTIISTSDPFTVSNRVFELPTPQIFEVGEMLIVQTGTVIGTWTDVRVGFRFEEIA